MRLRVLRHAASAMIAACIAANMLGAALAQPVDIEKELSEQRQLKVPFFRSHPWQRFRRTWLEEMESVDRELGLRAGVSFSTIYQHAAGVDAPNDTFVGNLDVFAHWRLLDLGALGEASAAGLFRTRANFAELNGNQLSERIGLPWGTNNAGSPGYSRFNQFWWEQALLHRALILKFGRLDQSLLFGENRAAPSDGKQFMMQPLVQSQTVAFPSNGAGLNLRCEPNERFYVMAGFGDANGNPDVKPKEGVDSFAQGKYFEAAEIGVSPNLSSIWAGAERGTYRFMGWHTVETDSHPGGYGFALSFDQDVGEGLVPFVRFGICPDDVFKTSIEFSGGIAAVSPFGRETDRAGIAASWSRPVAATRRDQFAMELFYRLELVEGIAIAPDAELIAAPATQPGRDFVAVFGLRVRLSL